MKKLNIKLPAGVTRAFGKATLEIKKHSPEILMIAGIGCGIASTVIACCATTKVEESISNETEMLGKIHEYEEDPERAERVGYDIEKDAYGNQFGWVYDPSRMDNDVDFGIYVSDDPENIDFINGIGKSVRLHFNVDGDILSNNLFRKFDQEHPVAK